MSKDESDGTGRPYLADLFRKQKSGKQSAENSEGITVAIIGSSGCGKSTLMYSIACLEGNTEGDIFIALKGGARDGHDFVLDAINRGAGLAIVSQDVKDVPESKVIKVEDTFEALQDLAEYKRQNSKAHFIGITGSVGKTSTKEILGLVLESFGKTFISRNNFNNQIGVPINLASLSDDDE
jgi:ABC-type proline/glycine betaine transport system ATPase subunit